MSSKIFAGVGGARRSQFALGAASECSSLSRNMGLNEEEISRLYKIRKTVFQMLRDRGYLVADIEIDMSKLDFKSKFGGEHVKREDLVISTTKKDNSSDQIYVFFPDEPKVGVSVIKTYINRMNAERVFKAILVVQQDLSPPAKKFFEISSKFQLEVFQEAELVFNLTEHKLVPEHQVLTDAEKKSLLERYTLKEIQLPIMLVTDPVSKYYGLKLGQVVKIIRPSATADKYVTYRLVAFAGQLP